MPVNLNSGGSTWDWFPTISAGKGDGTTNGQSKQDLQFCTQQYLAQKYGIPPNSAPSKLINNFSLYGYVPASGKLKDFLHTDSLRTTIDIGVHKILILGTTEKAGQVLMKYGGGSEEVALGTALNTGAKAAGGFAAITSSMFTIYSTAMQAETRMACGAGIVH